VWGLTGDKPAPGDYDGDGKHDFVIARGGGAQYAFWSLLSNGGATSVQNFGIPTDTIVTGDFDGDSKTDLAVTRNVGGALNWFWRPSGGGADAQVAFGLATDAIAVGDYDGDAKADPAIWRGGNFWTLNSNTSTVGAFALGSAGDLVPASYNSH
jgi:hypothetical protein